LDLTLRPSRDVRFLHRFVKRAAKLLDVESSSRWVARSFDVLLAEVQAAIESYPQSARAAAWVHSRRSGSATRR